MSELKTAGTEPRIHPIRNKMGGVFMHVSNMERSVNWYHKLFGMPERSSVTDKVHALAMEGGTGFVLDQHGYDRKLAPADRPMLMLDSPDVHAAYRFLQEIGVKLDSRIEEYPNMAFFTFRDPDNNLLMVCGKPGGKDGSEDSSPEASGSGKQADRYDGGGCRLSVSDSSYYGAVTPEGLKLTGRAHTDDAYAVPLRIETKVRIDDGCLRLHYGKRGSLTFNYGPSANNGVGSEFYVGHPIADKQFAYIDKGAVPTGEWVRLEWTVAERYMEVRVNGRLFHSQEGYFGSIVSKAGIGCDNGRITVQSFFVESLSEQDTVPTLPMLVDGNRSDELVPDASCYPQVTGEGLWLSYNEEWGSARSGSEYAVPYKLEAVVRSDTNSVVLYGGASGRVKFHPDGSLSYIDPVTRQESWVEGRGRLNEGFSTIEWRLEANRTTVSVDGETRFECEGSYTDCRFPLGIGADIGSVVVVRSVKRETRTQGGDRS
ncbi:MAG: hypothetical protein K0Q94_2950 [Paenibacillus sp.]|jgi:catechol 2,3-dioxygenase-like lactoylglutathione lyase family enzyme|nr:hypothetical protein [Paenibacillus sp.]